MKLKKFNRSTQVSRGTSGTPFFSITKKGTIRINREGQQLLQANIGDKINIYNDEENPIDWFIEKTSEAEGIIMRKCTGGGLICNSVSITNNIFKSLLIEKVASLSMRIAPNPIEDGSSIYAIFTLSSGRK